MNTPTPYPSEYTLVPRSRRRPRFWLLLLVAVALLLGALATRAHPAHPAARPSQAAAVAHQAAPAAPPRPGVTVKVGSVSYTCTIPLKPKR
jgi:hypothetical protein